MVWGLCVGVVFLWNLSVNVLRTVQPLLCIRIKSIHDGWCCSFPSLQFCYSLRNNSLRNVTWSYPHLFD